MDNYKIKLDVQDRVNILLNLPANGTRSQVKTIIDIKDKINLTDKEGATIALVRQENGVSVNYLDLEIKDKTNEYNLTKEELLFLKEIVSTLDTQGRFSESNIKSLEKIRLSNVENLLIIYI